MFDIAGALAALPDIYDFYALEVRLRMPALLPGTSFCAPSLPLGTTQGASDQQPNSDGNLNFDLVRWSSGESLPTSDHAQGPGVLRTDFEPFEWIQYEVCPGWTLGIFDEPGTVNVALVINPSPTYPVPDLAGNESGQVLWTRAQLVAQDGVLGLDWTAAYGEVATVDHVSLDATVYAFLLVDESLGEGTITAGPPTSGIIRRDRR